MPFMGAAHVLGGILFRVAIGLTGFCPGTCFTKAGGGAGSKRFATGAVAAGLVTGVLVYAGIKDLSTETRVVMAIQEPMTLHGLLGLPYGPVALVWGAMFIVIALVVDRVTPEAVYASSVPVVTFWNRVRGEWSWLVSGLIVGLTIVVETF